MLRPSCLGFLSRFHGQELQQICIDKDPPLIDQKGWDLTCFRQFLDPGHAAEHQFSALIDVDDVWKRIGVVLVHGHNLISPSKGRRLAD